MVFANVRRQDVVDESFILPDGNYPNATYYGWPFIVNGYGTGPIAVPADWDEKSPLTAPIEKQFYWTRAILNLFIATFLLVVTVWFFERIILRRNAS